MCQQEALSPCLHAAASSRLPKSPLAALPFLSQSPRNRPARSWVQQKIKRTPAFFVQSQNSNSMSHQWTNRNLVGNAHPYNALLHGLFAILILACNTQPQPRSNFAQAMPLRHHCGPHPCQWMGGWRVGPWALALQSDLENKKQ